MAVDRCEMIVGFLVPHRCALPGLAECMRCGRRFCDEHLEIETGGLVCRGCSKGLEQPVMNAVAARPFTAVDVAIFETAGVVDNYIGDDDTFDDLS